MGDTAHENVFRYSYLESREPSVAKAQDYIVVGGDTTHTLFMRGTIGIGDIS